MTSPKADVDLRHPVPDLQSLQGAYVGNINRLEEHAERMSEAGSDLQEEIRKTYSELKLTDSRRSSLRDIHSPDEPTRQASTRSRGVSISSHANSIVDLNGNARWGGYSPGGYITSPAGSLRSGTGPWPKPSNSVQRQRSESKASRLGQIVHPEEVEEESYQHQNEQGDEGSSASPPQRKVSSFTRIFDEVANGLPEELRNSIQLGRPDPDELTHEDTHYQYADHRDLPDRPPTAASTDTTHQARTLWQDFDGVHCPDTVEEEPEPSHHSRQSSYAHSRHSSNPQSFMHRQNPSVHSIGAPPPDDGMVFYPAPVPKMLNLPKRLSQLPNMNQQAKRRTQLLETMQTEHRKSMPLLGDNLMDAKPNKKSRQSLMALPPQLRASAYFDNRAAPAQEFAVKGESAEDTLESILDASANAPVSAFTDHPFAGHVGNEVYGPEHKRKSSKLPEVPPTLQQTQRRSSFNILDTDHNAKGERLKKLKKRNSSADMNLLLVKASESRMSLGDQLEERDEDARGPAGHDPDASRPSFEEGHPEDAYEEEESSEEEGEPEPEYGAPTTLLAELQIRKAKQQTRKMNYVTLMEQGLIDGRQTLLQMNDVAEAEKQRRIRKRVNLAWEAPVEEDSDDDVPLGVLYKQTAPPQMRQKSMGLIEQRELEDREPLSSRRNRLLGADPNQRRTQYLGASTSQINIPQITTPDPDSDEEPGESLADRMRRIKEKKERETALGDVRKSTVSDDFASEMMSKFGAPEATGQEQSKDAPAAPVPAEEEEEEETLGQRRAQSPSRSCRPEENRPRNLAPTVLVSLPPTVSQTSSPPTPSTLTTKLARSQMSSSSLTFPKEAFCTQIYGSMDPLLKGVGNNQKDDDDIPLGQKIQAYKNAQNPMMMNGQQRMSTMPQQGMMGMQMPMQMNSMQQPMMGQMGPMGMQMGMQQPGMMQQNPMMGMPMQMNGMGMQMPMQMNGMQMGGMQMPMGMNGMNMGMMQGGMMGPPMDPRQRDQIDRWMQGIRH
ncbi:unnamed protein product [Alternaria alternata]